MKYIIDPAIFSSYPHYLRGVIILEGIDNRSEKEEAVRLLRQEEERIQATWSLNRLREEPRIQIWREAFLRFGSNPNRYPPSVESLFRRILKGNRLPYVNTLVALMNVVSLRYVFPCGGDDLGKVTGNLLLTYAQGDEQYIPLNGDTPEPPERGEIIYRDAEKVLCRKWTWRQGDQTKITESTTRAAMNVDSLLSSEEDTLREALQEATTLFVRYCGGRATSSILKPEQNVLEIGMVQ